MLVVFSLSEMRGLLTDVLTIVMASLSWSGSPLDLSSVIYQENLRCLEMFMAEGRIYK